MAGLAGRACDSWVQAPHLVRGWGEQGSGGGNGVKWLFQGHNKQSCNG